MTESQLETDPELVRAKITTETARIPWAELQRFFASGKTLFVDTGLDLIDAAYAFHIDDSARVEQWIESEQVRAVSDEQARQWIAEDHCVWAVVVKPWVLIQDRVNN